MNMSRGWRRLDKYAGMLGSSDVNPNPNADYLVFEVRSSNPDLAARLATAYAKQFTIYRNRAAHVDLQYCG